MVVVVVTSVRLFAGNEVLAVRVESMGTPALGSYVGIERFERVYLCVLKMVTVSRK